MFAIPPWTYAVAAGVTFAAGFGTAWQVQQWRWQAHEAKELRAQERAFQRQLEQQQQESVRYEAERDAARVASRDRQETIREIYRDREVPGACAAPDSVRSVLEDAVDGANAAASGKPRPTVSEPSASAGSPD